MFPPSAAPILFGLILSGMMTLFVTCITKWRAISFGDGFVALWVGSWLAGWLVAFPMVLILAPLHVGLSPN